MIAILHLPYDRCQRNILNSLHSLSSEVYILTIVLDATSILWKLLLRRFYAIEDGTVIVADSFERLFVDFEQRLEAQLSEPS